MIIKSYRILLVDDEEQPRIVSQKILEKLGYNVIAHSRPEDALELYSDLPDHFDLIITDYRMPGMNGAELSEAVKKINPDIPIIMVSGFSSNFGKEDAEALGIDMFVRKPLLTKDFAQLVEGALALSKKQ